MAKRPKDDAETRRALRFAKKKQEEAADAADNGAGADGPFGSAQGKASNSWLTVAWAVLSGEVISIERRNFAVEWQWGGLNGT